MKFSISLLLLLSSPLLVLSEKHGSSPIISHNRMALLKRGSKYQKELVQMFALDTTNSTADGVSVKDTTPDDTSDGGILGSIIGGLTGSSATSSSDSSSATSDSSTSSSTSDAATTTTSDAATTTSSSSDSSSSATPSSSDSSSSSAAVSSSSPSSASSSSSSASQASPTSQTSATTTSSASATTSAAATASPSASPGEPASGSSSDSVVEVTATLTSVAPSGSLSSNTAAESSATTSDKKSGGLSGIELAGIIVGSSLVGILLIFTVIRKWVFKPSSRFEDKLNPIDFGDDQPGFSSTLHLTSEKPLPSTEQSWESFSVTNSAEQHDRVMSEVSSQKATATLNGGKTIEWPQVPLPPIPSAVGGLRSGGSLKRGDSWGSNGGRSLTGGRTQVNVGGYERSMTPVQGSQQQQGYPQLPYPGESRRPNEGVAFDPYYRGGY